MQLRNSVVAVSALLVTVASAADLTSVLAPMTTSQNQAPSSSSAAPAPAPASSSPAPAPAPATSESTSTTKAPNAASVSAPPPTDSNTNGPAAGSDGDVAAMYERGDFPFNAGGLTIMVVVAVSGLVLLAGLVARRRNSSRKRMRNLQRQSNDLYTFGRRANSVPDALNSSTSPSSASPATSSRHSTISNMTTGRYSVIRAGGPARSLDRPTRNGQPSLGSTTTTASTTSSNAAAMRTLPYAATTFTTSSRATYEQPVETAGAGYYDKVYHESEYYVESAAVPRLHGNSHIAALNQSLDIPPPLPSLAGAAGTGQSHHRQERYSRRYL